jgi:epoxyqueuosine reductase
MSPGDLTRSIKSKACDLGFTKAGVARADALTEEGAQLREWLNRGYQASMQWISRNAEKRVDPRLLLPEAKSVVCVAMNYYASPKHEDDPAAGKISRYAWGDDYHDIVTTRLEKLSAFIQTQAPSSKAKIYVDTGLVMDKAWAVRAGIGWLGKHTNVITREFGSWIFLGEIILDIELEYDKSIDDLCGTCTACIDACPTGAIVEPYVLDSNRCISYLTIEPRGDLPKELVPKFDHWVYGCDICQDVCPWNRFEKETEESSFRPRQENISPDLVELSKFTKEEFSRRFHHSPVKRTKHAGLVRNARALLESQTSSK